MIDIDVNKIEKMIKDRFPIIYDFDFGGLVYLYGGAIRDIIMNKQINDLDFVILSQNKCRILDFINKYNLEYKRNVFGGYKIIYNGIEVDIYTTDDLMIVKYDIDMLMYDLDLKMIISCGAYTSIKNREIIELDYKKKTIQNHRRRLKKLVNFVKFVNGNNKHVRVKQNRIYSYARGIRDKVTKIRSTINNGNFRKCFRFLNGALKEFKLVIILGILISLINASIPLLSGNLVEKILNFGFESVMTIVIIMVVLKLVSIIFSYLFSKLYFKIKKTMVFNIRKEVFSNVINLEMNNFTNTSSGNFINKIKDDSNDIANSFNKLKDIIVGFVGNFGIIIYIFYLNIYIGMILIFFMIIIYKIKMIGIKKKISARRESLIEQEKYSSMLNEMMIGMKDIKSLNIKEKYTNRTIDSFQRVSDIDYSGDYFENIYNKLSVLLEFISFGIILIFGMFLIKNKLLLPSSLVIIYMYKSSIYNFLDRLTNFMDIKLTFNLSCNRIFSIIDNNKYSKEKYGNKYLNKCKGKIEFKDVYFKYKDKDILKGISFKIDKHSILGIVGPSGVGKTTILNLITKMYSTNRGKILIDDVDINELSEEYIRNNISIVSQNPYFFDMSIKDNLKLVRDNLSDEEIEGVCRKVYLDDFINTLPNKYDTVLGEGANILSQGQKQRLAIARTLLKGTSIILLDEVTSALDKENADNVKKLINSIKKDYTIIIVSHDISLLNDYPFIELKNGKIIS